VVMGVVSAAAREDPFLVTPSGLIRMRQAKGTSINDFPKSSIGRP
jgi:hypothetical protein